MTHTNLKVFGNGLIKVDSPISTSLALPVPESPREVYIKMKDKS